MFNVVNIMGYVSIFVGFAVLVALCMLNVNVMVSSFAAAVAVTVLAGLPFGEATISVFFSRFGSVTGSLFPMFLFGAILAKLYTSSGAASVIADAVCNALFKKAKNQKQTYTLGFLSVILAAAILCYGGINAAVALIAIYPIAINIFERAGIPKRFIMGAICGGAFTFALSGPGSPQPTNVVAMAIGTGSTAGLTAGIVGALVEIMVMLLIFTKMCVKATEQGEVFQPGPADVFLPSTAKKTGLIPALVPIVVLLIIFNVLKVEIALSILITAVVAGIVFYPVLSPEKLLRAINDGCFSALVPAGAIAGVNGFAAVVQQVPEYQTMIDGLLRSTMPPILLLVLCIALICMMTGGSTTGAQIALPIITPVLTQLGLTLPFIHRVGTFAATMLDSLPNSGSVIMAVGLADLKMKEGYPPVFVSTVLATSCGTAAVALFMTLFPMLP